MGAWFFAALQTHCGLRLLSALWSGCLFDKFSFLYWLRYNTYKYFTILRSPVIVSVLFCLESEWRTYCISYYARILSTYQYKIAIGYLQVLQIKMKCMIMLKHVTVNMKYSSKRIIVKFNLEVYVPVFSVCAAFISVYWLLTWFWTEHTLTSYHVPGNNSFGMYTWRSYSFIIMSWLEGVMLFQSSEFLRRCSMVYSSLLSK